MLSINKRNIIYIVIVLLFFLISLFIGSCHEPWADEAHAWLIARDTSLSSLFLKYLHTDGHPALWHLILKTFQLFHFPYKYFYIIPVIFSTLGVLVFEFKSKFPLIIKILFPFTFFILYQYTVVARGYCLLFLILSLIATIWDDRFKRPFLFTFLLFLLINTEAYTYIFSGSIFLFYLYDIIRNKTKFRNYKHIISLIFLFIFFIVTYLYVHPIPSNTFTSRMSNYFISDSFITTFKINISIKLILSIILVFYVLFSYIKNKEKNKIIHIYIYLFPVFCFYIFFYNNLWHFGIMLLLLIFVVWIQKDTNNKYIFVLLLVTCIIQCFWSIKSCYYEFSSNYTGAREAANFLKRYDCRKLKIYGVSFYESAINPYFDYNIYDNWDEDIGFFYWNTKNKYYSYSLDAESLVNNKVDIVVSSDIVNKYESDLLDEKYNVYKFKGYTYFENDKFEDQTYTIYVSKEVDKTYESSG